LPCAGRVRRRRRSRTGTSSRRWSASTGGGGAPYTGLKPAGMDLDPPYRGGQGAGVRHPARSFPSSTEGPRRDPQVLHCRQGAEVHAKESVERPCLRGGVRPYLHFVERLYNDAVTRLPTVAAKGTCGAGGSAGRTRIEPLTGILSDLSRTCGAPARSSGREERYAENRFWPLRFHRSSSAVVSANEDRQRRILPGKRAGHALGATSTPRRRELNPAGKAYLAGRRKPGKPPGFLPVSPRVRFAAGFLHLLTAVMWFGTILYVHLLLKPAYASRVCPAGS